MGKSGWNPYHILTVSNYKFFAIIALISLVISVIFLLIGVICPFWSKTADTTTDWGPFMCLQNSSFSSCSLNFTNTDSSQFYEVGQIMSALSAALAIVSLGVVIFLLVRMTRQILFDDIQKYVTIGALVAELLALIAGFATLGFIYHKVVNGEGLTFSTDSAPCGITFAVGCVILCFAFAMTILLILYRSQQTPEDDIPPSEPAPLPVRKTPAAPPYQKTVVPYPKSAPPPMLQLTPPNPNSVAPPAVQYFQQRGAEVPGNPYGYTGDPIHDTQMHWLHRWYHHFSYQRPTYPYVAPANTLPPR